MKQSDFNECVEIQVNMCMDTLLRKGEEYATLDRFHNFRTAAVMQNISMKQALCGMLAKHITSIFDMCYAKHEYSHAVWEEKLTDAINYLLILSAMIDYEKPKDDIQ